MGWGIVRGMVVVGGKGVLIDMIPSMSKLFVRAWE